MLRTILDISEDYTLVSQVKTPLKTSGEDAKTTLETSGEDVKLHSKRVEKM